MSVNRADRPSELARFHRDLRSQAIARKALALGKSVGTPLYLISLGFIATWTIGVFFGVGFFFLVHHSQKLVSGLGAGNRGTDIISGFAESRESSRIAIGEPALIIAPSAENEARTQREFSALAELRMNSDPGDRESRGFAVKPQTLGTRDDKERIRPLPFEAAGSRALAQSAHPDSARERRKRQPSAAPTPRPHAPQKAIRDLLQKYTHLLE
jgi:hypothetical protein